MDLAGDKPLLLVVDDLHWVDHPSLRFLSYLVRRLEGVQIAIVAATRPNEPGADAALLAELAGDPLATSIRPGGLSPDGVRGVIEQRLDAEPDPSFAERLPRGHRRQPAAPPRAAEGDHGRGHGADRCERRRRLRARAAGRVAGGAAAPLAALPRGRRRRAGGGGARRGLRRRQRRGARRARRGDRGRAPPASSARPRSCDPASRSASFIR